MIFLNHSPDYIYQRETFLWILNAAKKRKEKEKKGSVEFKTVFPDKICAVSIKLIDWFVTGYIQYKTCSFCDFRDENITQNWILVMKRIVLQRNRCLVSQFFLSFFLLNVILHIVFTFSFLVSYTSKCVKGCQCFPTSCQWVL